MKVHASGYEDIIYTGSGTSIFDQFSTDANVIFVRQYGEIIEVTLLDGSFLKYQDIPWIDMSEKADYIAVKKDGNTMDYRIQASPDLRGVLFNGPIDPAKIQNGTMARQQKDTAVTESSTGIYSEDSFDFVSFVKKIAKQIISFLP